MPTILVVGATGKQGGAVVDALLDTSPAPTVRALTRNPTSPAASALAARGVSLLKGDLNDRQSLLKAFEGIDSAFLVTDMNKVGVEAEVEQGKSFIDALKAAPVGARPKQLVFSSVGSSSNAPSVPHFRSKSLVEEHLKATLTDADQISWTILRPVAFMDNFPLASSVGTVAVATFFKALLDTKTNLQWIACRDIGRVAARILTSTDVAKYHARTIELAGDEKSYGQVMDTFGQITGSRPYTLPLPRFLVQKMAGYDMSQMFKFFREKGYEADIPKLRSEFGDLWTWKEYIESARKSAA